MKKILVVLCVLLFVAPCLFAADTLKVMSDKWETSDQTVGKIVFNRSDCSDFKFETLKVDGQYLMQPVKYSISGKTLEIKFKAPVGSEYIEIEMTIPDPAPPPHGVKNPRLNFVFKLYPWG